MRPTLHGATTFVVGLVALAAPPSPATAQAESGDDGLISAAAFFRPAPAAPDLALGVRRASATLSGVTPGGSALFYRLSLATVHHASTRLERVARIVLDDDRDGRIDLDVATPVGSRAVWLAVDLETRRNLLLISGEGTARPLELSLVSVRHGTDPRVADHVLYRSKALAAIVLRPTATPVAGEAYDGDASDSGSAVDGTVELALGALEPIVSESIADKPVPRFAPGDVVLLVDPRRLQAALLVVREGV